MSAEGARLRTVRRLAWLIVGLSLLVVAVSAYLRLDAAGLGCGDWPACYGQILGGPPTALQYGTARLLHRVAASAALLLTLLLVWRCLRPVALQPAARYATILLVLMLSLSALGFFSADPRRALVGFLNIVGGLALVSFSYRIVLATDDTPLSGVRLAIPLIPAFRFGIAALSVAVAVGAWIGATYSAVACQAVPLCVPGSLSAADILAAFNPLARPEAAAVEGDSAATFLHLLHRIAALLALVLLAWVAWRARSAAVWRVWGLAALTALLGSVAVAGGMPLWVVVVHGTAAAAMLAAVAALLRG